MYYTSEEAEKNLNYEKIHDYMKLINHTWREQGVPSIEEIKEFVLLSIADMENNPGGALIASGGIMVVKIKSSISPTGFIWHIAYQIK